MDILKNSNILVTGASGFLGGHLVKNLLEKNLHVIGLFHHQKHSYLHDLNLQDNFDIAYGDITDIDFLRNLLSSKKIEYIFHCAANPVVKYCSKDPLSCLQVNTMGTALLLEAARQVGGLKGIMCMDSDKSYGHNPNLPLSEASNLNPCGIYEVSKACSGFIANGYRVNYEMPIFVVRSANLYGPGDRNDSRLVPGNIKKIAAEEQPILYDGVENYIREFIYIDDAVAAIISLMEKRFTGYINIGTGIPYTIKEVIDTLIRLMGSSISCKVVKKEKSHLEIEKQTLDISKLKNELPHFQPMSLESGLTKTIAWYT